MKGFLIKLLISTILIIVISHFLGIQVQDFTSAIVTAVVLSLLNTFIKPVLVVLTIPVTFFTLGLFLLVINTMMVLTTDYFVDGFKVPSFFTAFLFSIILSISQSVLNKIFVD